MQVRKIFGVFIGIIAISSLIVGCNTTESNEHTNELKEQEALSFVSRIMVDVDGDNELDEIAMYDSAISEENGYTFKVTYKKDSYSQSFFGIGLSPVMSIINAGTSGKGVLITFNNKETLDQSGLEPRFVSKYAAVMLDFKEGRIIPYLIESSDADNQKTRFSIVKNGNDIKITDSVTGFEAEYEPVIPEEYMPQYKQLDELTLASTLSSSGFSNIEIQNSDSDGKDEIVFSRSIPGISHNGTLGVIDYQYAFNNGRWMLTKETLYRDNLGGKGPVVTTLEFKN